MTRNGGQLFQCQNAAHFLEDEGLEAYLQNYGEGSGSVLFGQMKSFSVLIGKLHYVSNLK